MEEKQSNRSRIVGVRLSPKEYLTIEKQWKNSTANKLSEYIRAVIFEKPITTTFRNQSLDDLIVELGALRQELNRIGVNFNQSVKKLHTLRNTTEFRTWMMTHELEKRTMLNKIDEIKTHLQKITAVWLQS